ncbi:hypothetical protein BST28156_03094 [Burkholderia stagnalis]|nr:hypothetical protein BST28156_03094 [Burkholderia stagnalis]
MRLSSSSTFVSGAIMSDMLASDGGSPGVAPGNAAMPPNGDRRTISHIRSSMSAGWKPAKPEKGLEPVLSVVMRASWLTGGSAAAASRGRLDRS